MIDRIRREPVLITLAVVVVIFNFDIVQLTDTVNQIIELMVVVGAGAAVRRDVTPKANLEHYTQVGIAVSKGESYGGI